MHSRTAAFRRYLFIMNSAGTSLSKRLFDVVCSVLALAFLSPIFLFVAVLVRRDGGSALYSHERVGLGGKTFFCLKFRSMYEDSDTRLEMLLASDPKARQEWTEHYKLKQDPRITPVGHFLRESSIDELPQLVNVLKGDMSLVGPRPVIVEELGKYGDAKEAYLSVRPGLTGLWQVSGRNDLDYKTRVNLDTEYIESWSFKVDVIILLKTIRVVLERRGAY